VVDRLRRVGAHLVFDALGPVYAVLQVGVSGMGPAQVDERLEVRCDDRPAQVREVPMPNAGRAHVLRSPPGRLTVDYNATVLGDAASAEVTEADRVLFLRPSRYGECDRLAATAQTEFMGIEGGEQLLAAVSSWVGSRLVYEPGSSTPTCGAVDTLLRRRGVCRDYAHLVVALLRALDVPARVAAVYAPGLRPMDFHAVAEALVDDVWRVVDATLLAPRASLVRIATGRDAADTAFLSTYGGAVNLLETEVTAVINGGLPDEDVLELVSIK
jgi:transglutaminase-like putative cysteine protease